MPNCNFTRIEASKSWVLRACGWKTRDIRARFGVDPRRLYDVWEEKVQRDSRESGIRLFKRILPGHYDEDRFRPHVPKYKRIPVDENQLRLPF